MPQVRWKPMAIPVPNMNERPIPSHVQSFPLVYIAYFKVLYNGGNYAIDGSTSGYYEIPVPAGIDGFVSDLVSYETPQKKWAMPIVPNGFGFELQYNSYVLFHLESGTIWQYRFSADGIAMDDLTSGEYMNLVHVDQHGNKRYGGNITPDPNNTTPPNTPFRVAYFSAKTPSAKGKLGQNDNFDIWVYKGGQEINIDPSIKNDGQGGIHTHTK